MHCKKNTDSKSAGGAQQVLKELGKQTSPLLTGEMDLFALKLLGRPLTQNGGSAGHSEDELDCKSPASEGSACTLKDEPRSTVPPLAGRFSDSLLMAYVNSFLMQKQSESVDIEGKP
jgi:hypothetical protein